MQKISQLHPVEKVLVAFLALVALFSGGRVLQAFYLQHSDPLPTQGGTYTEGAVGKLGSINPLFVQQGSVTADITQLVFSGLTKYDPVLRSIVGDLADYKISPNGKEYTFVIKEGARWHDGEPVTSNDVLFTYETVIKDPEFKGLILNYNDYSGMKVAKIDERTVKFLLDKPDSFFLVKTMTGLLPAHLLSDLPVTLIGESPYSFQPIGSGHYRFVAATPVNESTEVSLLAFDDFYGVKPHIKNLLIKVFPTDEELTRHLGELDGVRNLSAELAEKALKGEKFVVYRYQLPQYVAAFINTESPLLKNSRVRLALQLGTDKEDLVKRIGQSQTVDTPLMEIDQKNWMHQYSVKNANGALFDTEWKIQAVSTAAPVEAPADPAPKAPAPDEAAFINGPNGGNDLKTTESKITLTGTVPPKTKAVLINDYELKKFVPGDKAWSYIASEEYKNLRKGENVFNLYAVDFNGEKKQLDRITVTYGDPVTFTRMDAEKRSEENDEAGDLPLRVNPQGETLSLNLITSDVPAVYADVAAILKEQWRKIGVGLDVEVLDSSAFQKRLAERSYDLVIFGQNLGYNLDAYPYWHSSQAKPNGLNLSQFKNFAVDSLLEEARLKLDDEDRKKTLHKIQSILSQEVPAVFLYSPTYTLAQSDRVQNASFENLATTSDRFASIENWYGRSRRRLREDVGFFTFFGWIFKQF